MGIPIGTRFGSLVTLEKPKKTNKTYGVLCKCDCGNEKIFQTSSLRNGRTKRCIECSRTPLPKEYCNFTNLKHSKDKSGKLIVEMECMKCKNIKIVKKAIINGKYKVNCPVCNEETSDKGICITIFKKIKANADKRNIEFLITSEYLYNLYIKQNKKCALTGVDIILVPKSIRTNHNINTASLDRIDSTKGYIENNIRWVHKTINQFISDFSDDEVFYLCNLILKNNTITDNNININDINKLKQRNTLNTKNKKQKYNPKKKPVQQYSLDMVLIKTYSSINEAIRELNIPSPSGIIATCKGKQKSSGGFIWKYKNTN
jgi:hypothetical protein